MLSAHAGLAVGGSNPDRAERLNQVLLTLTITLIALAAVNAIFITWATALDARRSSALDARAGRDPAAGRRGALGSAGHARPRRRPSSAFRAGSD